ncbi:Rho GTPase-activating protein 20 [Zancudomyces culisetae]|uniref:Rho GTPase-activating protein 20 n=1 Tax=Zancudomyces culisetae TaxID=1213189 RepID=A0A1R1PUS6_ZANCU|nr:Rho GTPase-activating protein 20 [Zancudomyces culisetae]|eukprot:OMH84677.1 Rho GTPase-activating protein 20 [Zancudomyces culisetae]
MMLVNTLGAVISTKFYDKLVWVPTLAQLKLLVPTDLIYFPEQVIQADNQVTGDEKFKVHSGIAYTSTQPVKGKTFGVDLEAVLGIDNNDVVRLPPDVIDWLLLLHSRGTFAINIFKRVPNVQEIQQFKKRYLEGPSATPIHDSDTSAYLIAAMLRMYLAELDHPIFTQEIYSVCAQLPVIAPQSDSQADQHPLTQMQNLEQARISFVRSSILPSIPPKTRQFLTHIFALFFSISLYSSQNRMNSHNLAKTITPLLLRYTKDNIHASFAHSQPLPSCSSVASVVQVMILYFEQVFFDDICTILDCDFVESESVLSSMVSVLRNQLSA